MGGPRALAHGRCRARSSLLPNNDHQDKLEQGDDAVEQRDGRVLGKNHGQGKSCARLGRELKGGQRWGSDGAGRELAEEVARKGRGHGDALRGRRGR
jgi:hypothetical protein